MTITGLSAQFTRHQWNFRAGQSHFKMKGQEFNLEENAFDADRHTYSFGADYKFGTSSKYAFGIGLMSIRSVGGASYRSEGRGGGFYQSVRFEKHTAVLTLEPMCLKLGKRHRSELVLGGALAWELNSNGSASEFGWQHGGTSRRVDYDNIHAFSNKRFGLVYLRVSQQLILRGRWGGSFFVQFMRSDGEWKLFEGNTAHRLSFGLNFLLKGKREIPVFELTLGAN